MNNALILPPLVVFSLADSLMDLERKINHGGEYVPRPEVCGVLRYLKDSGVDMGVISASSGESARRIVKEQKWNNYFVAVVGAYDSGNPKPSIEAWQLFLHRAKMRRSRPSSVWFIGSGNNNAEFARIINAEFLSIQELENRLFNNPV